MWAVKPRRGHHPHQRRRAALRPTASAGRCGRSPGGVPAPWAPPCLARNVFVRSRAPRHALRGPSAVSCIVCRALRRAGIDSPFKGAHLLRHSLATQMLGSGASLGEIGQILRHRNPQTTTIYAKVDLASLRTLAMDWPGGAQ